MNDIVDWLAFGEKSNGAVELVRGVQDQGYDTSGFS